MTNVEINKQARLSQHFTLGELCKTSANLENVPNEAQVNNLKRLCGWLEELRRRPSPSPSLLREGSEEPIIINSGYRSPEVNRAVGGVPNSNHLTGCVLWISTLQASNNSSIMLALCWISAMRGKRTSTSYC